MLNRDARGREVLVLLSGGLDSSACIQFYLDFGRPPCALFIDYGQRAAKLEARAASRIAAHYDTPLITCFWKGATIKPVGAIPGRNAFLVSAALLERPESVSTIANGIHAGTEYADCSAQFIAQLQSAVDLSESGRIELAAPFLTWSKADILEYCVSKGVPTHKTYSCERGASIPCGECLSCRDRQGIDARP